MELLERLNQIEQLAKVLRPELHFPSTATLEQRLRWLEIVFEEMKGRDNHGVYAETLDEEKLREVFGHTVYVKPDRITLHSLTADPASVVAGDLWFRSDFGKTKQAIDTVVANARLLRREGDTVPAAEIADLDTAKITTGRFPMTRMPDMALNKVMLGQGVGVSPIEGDAPPVALNAVKLPSPSASDYVTPSAMSASSESGAIRLYSGAEDDYYHAATIPGDGSLIRARITPPADSRKLYRQRVASPGPSSDFSQWVYTNQYNCIVVAAASLGSEVSIFWINSNREVRRIKSTDYGATWGSAELIDYSPTTAVYGLAAAYKPNGDLAIFFADQATLYVKKRVGGSWQSKAAWDKSTGDLSGVACVYDSDWNLLVTGKDTAGNFKIWKLVYGDGGYQAAGTWSSLTEIRSAPSVEYEYHNIFMDKFSNVYRAFYTEKFTGTGAYTLIYWVESSPDANFLSLGWQGFGGFDALDGSYGLAITYSTSLMWLSRADGVWQYPCYYARKAADDQLATPWRPNPANESNAWLTSDMGALKICGGCRIYWGADAAYRPTAYRLQVSEDGTTWTTVITDTTAPPASAWKEYSWNARYARYIRLIVDTHGSTGTEIFEVDYYSRITDRVAAEHGHGSGVEPYLEVRYSEGHPPMAFGDTLRERINRAGDNVKRTPTLGNLINLVEAQNELIGFFAKD